MGVFRPGKPWRALVLSGNAALSSGAQDVVWGAASGDGEWDAASDLTSSVVELAGLYLVTLELHTTNATPQGSLVAGIFLSGVVAASQSNPTGFQLQTLSVSWCGQLAQGVAIKARLTTFSAAKTLQPDGSSLTAVRIGPVRWT